MNYIQQKQEHKYPKFRTIQNQFLSPINQAKNDFLFLLHQGNCHVHRKLNFYHQQFLNLAELQFHLELSLHQYIQPNDEIPCHLPKQFYLQNLQFPNAFCDFGIFQQHLRLQQSFYKGNEFLYSELNYLLSQFLIFHFEFLQFLQYSSLPQKK